MSDMQFDRAEPAAGSAAAGQACAVCQEPISGTYYEINGRVTCERCRYRVEAEWNRASPAGRFGRALGLGLGAAIAGAAAWYGIALATDRNWGIVAIGVGLLVGAAVRKGSDGRGGWKYQTLAVLLTYGAIAAAQIPFIVEGLRQAAQAPGADSLATAAPTAADSVAAADLGVTGAAIALAVLGILIIASPILIGIESPLSLLIFGFALYEAWRMNQKVELKITGPYQVAPARGAGG